MMYYAGESVAEGTVFHLRQPIKLMGSHRRGIKFTMTLDALIVAVQDNSVGAFKMKVAPAWSGDESGYGMALQADLILGGGRGMG